MSESWTKPRSVSSLPWEMIFMCLLLLRRVQFMASGLDVSFSHRTSCFSVAVSTEYNTFSSSMLFLLLLAANVVDKVVSI